MDNDVPNKQTALYRLFNSDGVLLYIGITAAPDKRFASHAKTKAWWPEVAKREVTWHGNRRQAAEAEMSATRNEQPLHNIRGTARGDESYQRMGEKMRARRIRLAASLKAVLEADQEAGVTLPIQDAAQVAVAACRAAPPDQWVKDKIFATVIRTLAPNFTY